MKFLIDENLPDKLNIWSSKDFLHVTKLGVSLQDKSIWDLQKKIHQ